MRATIKTSLSARNRISVHATIKMFLFARNQISLFRVNKRRKSFGTWHLIVLFFYLNLFTLIGILVFCRLCSWISKLFYEENLSNPITSVGQNYGCRCPSAKLTLISNRHVDFIISGSYAWSHTWYPASDDHSSLSALRPACQPCTPSMLGPVSLKILDLQINIC